MNTPQFQLGLFAVAMWFGCAVHGAESDPAVSASTAVENETLAYVGTYTGAKSKGIYLFRLETRNPDVSQNVLLVPLGLAVETPSPAFLAVDPRRRLVFAVNEVNEFEGQPTGAVSAFSVDAATGRLTLLSQRSSKGTGPCHLILDSAGRNLLVANYGSGSVAVLPVQADGRLGEASDFVQHAGHSAHPDRQRGPHAHCVTLDPTNKFAFVCDLGLDKIMSYRFDAEQGKLTPNNPTFTAVAPGAGPRHMVFRPDGRFAYVVNELNSTVTALAYDREKGVLTELQTVSTLPEYFDGPNTTAEIDVHPSGKYLYASNRGHESVVLFEIDRDNGTLTFVEAQTTGGKTPRHFGIQPLGDHLAIANQDSDTLLLCRIDAGNGRLKPSGVFAEAPSPSCIVFLPPARSGNAQPAVRHSGRARFPSHPHPVVRYEFGPDSQRKEGVPQGRVTEFVWKDSKVYQGTIRRCAVYVPAQYDPTNPAALMVFQDGVRHYLTEDQDFRVPIVFDNLIAAKEMPVTIGVFIDPGYKRDELPTGREARSTAENRSFEYDSLSPQYSEFLLTEILPHVEKEYDVKITDDPAGRAICGMSSGGICAWTVAWERPDQFGKVVSHVGSFTNIRGGHRYPDMIRAADPKPIRVFLQDGASDNRNRDPDRNWVIANHRMAAALEEKDYDYKYVYGEGPHSGNHGGAIFPDTMRWLWRDYPK